jgi:hypothetical protein
MIATYDKKVRIRAFGLKSAILVPPLSVECMKPLTCYHPT